MRKNEKRNFIFPRAPDYSVVDKIDITLNLPPPKKDGDTSPFMEYFSFDVHISKYNVRLCMLYIVNKFYVHKKYIVLFGINIFLKLCLYLKL